MNLTYILVEIEIKNNMITPEDFKAAINKLPEDYKTTDDNPKIDINGNKAKIIFSCVMKSKSKKKVLY